MRIGCYLLAVVLLGAAAMQACFAGEAAGNGEGSNLSAKPDGSRPPSGEDAARGRAKLDNQPAPEVKGDDSKTATGEGALNGNAVAKDLNASGAGGYDPDGIDTHMTVQPRRLGGKRDEVGDAKIKFTLLAPGSLRPRRLSKLGTPDRMMRNAIGVPLARHGGLERRDGEHHDFPTVVRVPAAGATGVAGSGTASPATAEGRVDRPTILRANASPILSPVAPNRGTINGTSLNRPGFSPSGVGGPAKQVAGISGTAIRPKH